MGISSLLVQLVNGLAGASTLFLVAAGLSLIFGVTRIVNFAHGSFYMVGIYLAGSLVQHLGDVIGFWPSLLLAPLAVGVLGVAVEVLLLRRLYQAPELFQLLATFALVLVFSDCVLWLWGPDDVLGPRAPGLTGAVDLLGRRVPTYDLFLIAAGPAVLGLLWLLLTRTRWGALVRAATQDREMVSALGVDQAWIFTSVFALGAMLAGLGGALQLPREPATLHMDLNMLVPAFVVVVVGGMGSIPGAFLAALLIAQARALCIWIGVVDILGFTVSVSKLTLVVDFVVMALVLVWRPSGLLGRPQLPARQGIATEAPLHPASRAFLGAAALLGLALLALPVLAGDRPYMAVLVIDLLIAALFASSLHFIIGPAGLLSFGHAAYLGLGAYGAALLVRAGGWPMELALLGAPVVAASGAILAGWFAVRLTGVYLAMWTLAFAQIVWAVTFQWDSLTGGSNGLVGVWPAAWLADPRRYYWLTLGLVVAGVLGLRRVLYSPFGLALRAARDSGVRAEALGLPVRALQWMALVIAGSAAGLAGGLHAFSKGSISPETMAVGRSVDGLVMVLLGGVQSPSGPLVGAFAYTWLQDTVARSTEYWRAALGGVILLLVLVFPRGIAGSVEHLAQRLSRRAVSRA